MVFFLPPSGNGPGYSECLLAQDAITVMKQLDDEEFIKPGHDRGARVASRLALEMPKQSSKLISRDIISTHGMLCGFGCSIAKEHPQGLVRGCAKLSC